MARADMDLKRYPTPRPEYVYADQRERTIGILWSLFTMKGSTDFSGVTASEIQTAKKISSVEIMKNPRYYTDMTSRQKPVKIKPVPGGGVGRVEP